MAIFTHPLEGSPDKSSVRSELWFGTKALNTVSVASVVQASVRRLLQALQLQLGSADSHEDSHRYVNQDLWPKRATCSTEKQALQVTSRSSVRCAGAPSLLGVTSRFIWVPTCGSRVRAEGVGVALYKHKIVFNEAGCFRSANF